MEVLAEYRLPAPPAGAPPDPSRPEAVAVAVRGGARGQLLATAFHPEITADLRWHRLFASMCAAKPGAAGVDPRAAEAGLIAIPPLPVYESAPVLKYSAPPA